MRISAVGIPSSRTKPRSWANPSQGVSKRDNAEMLNKLYFLKRENDSLNERQEALEDQMAQLMKTVGDLADRAAKDKEQVQSSTKALAEARAEIGRLRDRVRVLEHDHNIPRPAQQQMSIGETQQRIDFHDSRIRWLESSLSKKK
jgi:predicted  nucleic acid-binding Zn-ribbon protein